MSTLFFLVIVLLAMIVTTDAYVGSKHDDKHTKDCDVRMKAQAEMEAQGYTFYNASYHYRDENLLDEPVELLEDIVDKPLVVDQLMRRGALYKRACVLNPNGCGVLDNFRNFVQLETNSCTESATNDDVLFCVDNGCLFLDTFFCNDFERGENNKFPLPGNFRISAASSVILKKFGGQLWEVRPRVVVAGGVSFFFSTVLYPRNCNCAAGVGLTMNDDRESCSNIFGGDCPRGYRFIVSGGQLQPVRALF